MENLFRTGFSINNIVMDFPCDGVCQISGKCKCKVIKSVDIVSINLIEISKIILKSLKYKSGDIQNDRRKKLDTLLYGGPQVDIYLIERYLSSEGLWCPTKWDWVKGVDYYGEKLDYIKIINGFDLHMFMIEKLIQPGGLYVKVNEALHIEGKIEEFTGVDLIDINKCDIILSECEISKKYRDYYSSGGDKIPLGIVRAIGDKYWIIDGYHRMISTKLDRFKVFLIGD